MNDIWFELEFVHQIVINKLRVRLTLYLWIKRKD